MKKVLEENLAKKVSKLNKLFWSRRFVHILC